MKPIQLTDIHDGCKFDINPDFVCAVVPGWFLKGTNVRQDSGSSICVGTHSFAVKETTDEIKWLLGWTAKAKLTEGDISFCSTCNHPLPSDDGRCTNPDCSTNWPST